MHILQLIVTNSFTEAIGLKMRFEIYLFIYTKCLKCEIGNYYIVEITPF